MKPPRCSFRTQLAAYLIPLLTTAPVLAQNLPQLEEPSRGAGNGVLQILRNHGYDLVLLIALILCAAIFVGVCYHAYIQYSEIHANRSTWGRFALTVAVGAGMIVLAIWLLNHATTIL